MSKRGENIYKRKDGRWEGRYIKGRKANGAVHYGYIYRKSYKEIKIALIEIKQQQKLLLNQESIDCFRGTFKEWANYWLETVVASNVKLSTYVSYKSKMNVHLLPELGEIALIKIEVETIQGIFDELANKLSVRSVHAVFRVLRSCFNHAKKKKLILVNPTEDIQLPKTVKRRETVLSIQEEQIIKKAAQSDPKGLPIILALETGMRIGEISGLKWSDIDFFKKVIYVNRTVQRLATSSGKTELVEDSPKTANSYRTIPVSKRLSKLLLERKKEAKGDYVVSVNAECFEPRAISYHYKRILKAAGIPSSVNFHMLRHTFATRCLEIGVNVATISSLLGHGSTKMTLDIYMHSSLKKEREAVEKIAIIQG